MSKLKKLHTDGFGTLDLLLTVIILAAIGFAGWKVYDSRRSTKPNNVNSTTVSRSSEKENKVPDGFVEYKNEELGFKFTYPKEWGQVKVNSNMEPAILLNNSFSNNSLVSFGVAQKDYKPAESMGDPPCVSLGFGTFSFLEATTQFPDHYYNKELLRTLDRQIVERYKTGYCGGNTLQGRVKLDLAQSNGLDITYFDLKNTEPYNSMTISEYMKDKNNLINPDFKKQFIDVVNSVQVIR